MGGQIGRHSPDHARALAEPDVLRRLLAVYLHQDSSEDLQTKAKRALKSVIQKCTHLPALEPLLQESPQNILKYVVQQFAKVLPHDLQTRRSFVQSGGLQKIQEVKAEVGSKLHDYIDEINMLYPPEIVQYYSPNYAGRSSRRWTSTTQRAEQQLPWTFLLTRLQDWLDHLAACL